MHEDDVGALDVVSAFLRSLEETGSGSRSLRRQRGWALSEAVLFAAVRTVRDVTIGGPLTAEERSAADAITGQVTLADLLDGSFVEEWVACADPVLRGVDLPVVATQRARVTSLRALAAFAGAQRPPHRQPKPALRPLLTEPEIVEVLRALTSRLPGRGPDDHVRLAAILSVMSVWPARAADLSALRRAQVRAEGSGLLLDVATAEPAALLLRGVAAERMGHWLDVRESLVSSLLGGPVHALWTSIRSNSRPSARGSIPLPPGMPLKPRGLQRAYARSVAAANIAHQGCPGFPLPRSLDLLRRSLRDTRQVNLGPLSE